MQACRTLLGRRLHVDQVTVSIGFTLFGKGLSKDALIAQADAALYYCKTSTRNVVHYYEDLIAKDLIPERNMPKSRHVETS